MDLEELRSDTTVDEWLTTIDAGKATRKNFISSMALYTEYTKMTPEQLLEEAEAEFNILPRKRKIKKHMLGFFSMLQKSGVSKHTVRSRMTAVRSFYKSNEIDLPEMKIRKVLTLEENDKVPTKEDLQDCLENCDIFEKAIMLTGISSGLASNELRNLKLQKFIDGYDPETGITTILDIVRGKTETKFMTFFSPEASKAVWKYLEDRDRPVKKGAGILREQQREKQHTTENSYLFILKNVPAEYLETHDEELRKMGENALEQMYRRISEKAKKDTKKGYNFIRSHTMRKYFNSILLNKGCDGFKLEYWMGHQIEEKKAAYFRANVEDQRNTYSSFVPYLTIQKEIDVTVNPEFLKMKERTEELEKEVVRVSVEREEIQRLKAEYDQKINNLEKSVRHELQMQLRTFDKLKHTAPEKERQRYANEAQKIRDKLNK